MQNQGLTRASRHPQTEMGVAIAVLVDHWARKSDRHGCSRVSSMFTVAWIHQGRRRINHHWKGMKYLFEYRFPWRVDMFENGELHERSEAKGGTEVLSAADADPSSLVCRLVGKKCSSSGVGPANRDQAQGLPTQSRIRECLSSHHSLSLNSMHPALQGLKCAGVSSYQRSCWRRRKKKVTIALRMTPPV